MVGLVLRDSARAACPDRYPDPRASRTPGFDAQADLDFVHHDLDPAAEFLDPFGLARCCGFRAIKPGQKFVEAGQVCALFI